MMDYSVISQIIRITKEKKKEERQLGILVSNYPLDSIVLGISQCGQKARLKGGMEREAQMVIYFFFVSYYVPYSQTFRSCTFANNMGSSSK